MASMKIMGYRRIFGGTVSMREVLIEDFHLCINPFGISFVRDAGRNLMNAVEMEELADEHLSLAYVESLISGVRQGALCARELQQMFGIEPESEGSFLIIVDETERDTSPGKAS